MQTGGRPFVALALQSNLHVFHLPSRHSNPRRSGAHGAGIAGGQWHLLLGHGRGHDRGRRRGAHDQRRSPHHCRRAQPQGLLLRPAHPEHGRRHHDRRPLRCAALRQRRLPSQPDARRFPVRVHFDPPDGRQLRHRLRVLHQRGTQLRGARRSLAGVRRPGVETG